MDGAPFGHMKEKYAKTIMPTRLNRQIEEEQNELHALTTIVNDPDGEDKNGTDKKSSSETMKILSVYVLCKSVANLFF